MVSPLGLQTYQPLANGVRRGAHHAVRPYWKGYLKLSLMTFPVAVSPATSESEKVRFHTINKATKNCVVSHYVDSVTGKEIAEKDEIKGFGRGGEYVTKGACPLLTCAHRAPR